MKIPPALIVSQTATKADIPRANVIKPFVLSLSLSLSVFFTRVTPLLVNISLSIPKTKIMMPVASKAVRLPKSGIVVFVLFEVELSLLMSGE